MAMMLEHADGHLRNWTQSMKSIDALPDAGVPGDRKGRKASKETRQQQLIEATIDSLAKRGYSDTTLANVADGAGRDRTR